MDALIANIILLLPGIVAYFIIRTISYAENRAVSDFEKTSIGLLYNIPGILLLWAAVSLVSWKFIAFKDFQSYVLQMPNFIFYLPFVFGIALLTALWWDRKGQQLLNKWIDKKRKEFGRPTAFEASPWEEFFGPEESAILGIYPIGERNKMVLGEVSRAFIPGDTEKGILLVGVGELTEWIPWFGHPERTYIDTSGKTVYEWYPTSAYEEAKCRAEKVISISQGVSEAGEL